MPPATKENTTPMQNLGDREAQQKPAIWMPPSGTSSLKMIITDNATGKQRDLTVSDKGNITWFRRDKSGALTIEERQADDEHTTMSLEINDKANTVNFTKRKLTMNKTIEKITENIYP